MLETRRSHVVSKTRRSHDAHRPCELRQSFRAGGIILHTTRGESCWKGAHRRKPE